MKNLYFLFLAFGLFAFPLVSRAQEDIRCGTVEYEIQELKQHPALKDSLDKWNTLVDKWVKTHKNYQTRGIITIPVVIHLVYNPAVDDIVSDWQVQSQIDILNEDLNRLNADAVKTPPVFIPVAADCGFHFCLAKRDPNGNPTTGILRETYSNQSSWGPQDFQTIKQTYWPESEYLNIWVCNLSQHLLGITVFPSAESAWDCGIVVADRAFGRVGSFLTGVYSLGRTLTHEFGHWVDCYHVWGNDAGDCSSSDSCQDTPNQGNFTPGCPPFPDFSTSNGGSKCNDTSDMYMNYLDYSNDSCMNIYTIDQKLRMLGAMMNYPLRVQIQSSSGCSLPTSFAYNYDLSLSDIKYPAQTVNKRVISPIITLSNLGKNSITSCKINYQFFLQQTRVYGNLHEYDWQGSLPSGQSIDVVLPSLRDSIGFSFLVTYAHLNDGTDGDTVNNFSSRSYYVDPNATFPPAGTRITAEYNPGSNIVTFQFDTLISNNYQIQVFNVLGQLIRFRSSSTLLNKVDIDLIDAPVGIYFARFRNGGNYLTSKFEYFPAQ